MGDKQKERQARINREWGTTSTGVQYDFRADPGEGQGHAKHKKRQLSGAQKKFLRRAAITVGAIAAFAALSIGYGDALWDRILPPLPAATARVTPLAATATPVVTASPQPTAAAEAPLPTEAALPAAGMPAGASEPVMVWIPNSGSRYHLTATCSGMKDAREVALAEAREEGFTPCKRCNPPE